MARTHKISIDLSSDMEAPVAEAVRSGEYASVSELLGNALRSWKQLRDGERELLGKLWDDGLASGEPIGGEEAFRRIDEELEKHSPRTAS